MKPTGASHSTSLHRSRRQIPLIMILLLGVSAHGQAPNHGAGQASPASSSPPHLTVPADIQTGENPVLGPSVRLFVQSVGNPIGAGPNVGAQERGALHILRVSVGNTFEDHGTVLFKAQNGRNITGGQADPRQLSCVLIMSSSSTTMPLFPLNRHRASVVGTARQGPQIRTRVSVQRSGSHEIEILCSKTARGQTDEIRLEELRSAFAGFLNFELAKVN